MIYPQGVRLINGIIVLANESVKNGYEGPHFVLDSNGITHAATYEELIEVVEYGAARSALCSSITENYDDTRGKDDQRKSDPLIQR